MVYQFLKYDTNGMQITIKDVFKWNANEMLELGYERRIYMGQENINTVLVIILLSCWYVIKFLLMKLNSQTWWSSRLQCQILPIFLLIQKLFIQNICIHANKGNSKYAFFILQQIAKSVIQKKKNCRQ